MKNYRIYIIWVLFIYFLPAGRITAVSPDNDSSIVLFPVSRLYSPIFLDPLECQTGGGSYFLFRKNEDLSLYSNVTLGFQKPVIAKHGKVVSWEAGLGVAVFSQFDLIKREDGSYLAGLLNNDYKLNGELNIRKENNIFRIRLFHVSSHLGDDYMLRTKDTVLNDKSVNYEQADLTWIISKGNNYFYAGVGEIYTKYVFRKRFSMQLGGYANLSEMKSMDIFASANAKLFTENDFHPDIRLAAGMAFKKGKESFIRIWAEYYSGSLPYSTINYGMIRWAGLAMAINLN